ncbi:Ig domain-containing protein, partial [Pseudomonas aeruginosa]
MSSGAKVQLAWIKEVTPGVTPPGDWHTLTRISNGVTPTYNSEANNEIG